MVRSTSASAFEFQRAKKVIPGGVNSPARAFGGVGGDPIIMERGDGPFLFDIDGNRYIDYIGSWGPFILGHRHPEVIAAIEAALPNSTSFGAPCRLETELAEKVVAAVPSIDMVRMVSSGTEAAMSAVRLARGFTGRNKIVKFAGCYHGHVDSLLVQAGSSATTLGVPNSPGVPPGAVADTIVIEFNDLDAIEAVFAGKGSEIAAILLEPVVGNMGLVEPLPGFLEALRSLTRKHGCLLIFDEVMTGFRLAYGGAQELFAVAPDLTVLGKIIGGGLPVGAYGGRREIMERVSPAGPVFQAGTLSGNPLAMASGLATLNVLDRERPYLALDAMSAHLADGLDRAATKSGIPHTLARVGSMITLFFHPEPVRCYTDAKRCDTKLFGRFFWKLIGRGVYWPCSQFEALFVSTAHTMALIDETIEIASDALRQL